MDVVSYIDSKDRPLRDILFHLHHLIMQMHPQVQSKIRFKIPFYDIHSWICYCNPLKKGGIELVFLKGNRIPDPFNLLNSKKRKMVKGVTIPSLEDFPEEQVIYYLLEAIGLDQSDFLAKKWINWKLYHLLADCWIGITLIFFSFMHPIEYQHGEWGNVINTQYFEGIQSRNNFSIAKVGKIAVVSRN